jgi:hypothetical protein
MEPTSPRMLASRRTLLLVLLGLLWVIPEVGAWAQGSSLGRVSTAPSALDLVVLALVIATLVEGLRGNPSALSVLASFMVSFGVILVWAGGASRGVIAVALCFLAMAIVVLLLRADVMDRMQSAGSDTPIPHG